MHFQRKQFVDKAREKLVKRYIIWITIGTMCPAVYLTYNIVRETFYQSAANHFITEELQFPDSQILSREISYDRHEIKVVFVGKEVSKEQIAAAQQRLADYNLTKTKLVVFQGMGDGSAVDISNIKSMVMEDFYRNSEKRLKEQDEKINTLHKQLADFSGSDWMGKQLGQELKVLFPEIKTLSVSKSLRLSVDSSRIDTLTYAIIDCQRMPDAKSRDKIVKWLKAKTGDAHLQLIVE